jgi:hypothetical protein
LIKGSSISHLLSITLQHGLYLTHDLKKPTRRGETLYADSSLRSDIGPGVRVDMAESVQLVVVGLSLHSQVADEAELVLAHDAVQEVQRPDLLVHGLTLRAFGTEPEVDEVVGGWVHHLFFHLWGYKVRLPSALLRYALRLLLEMFGSLGFSQADPAEVEVTFGTLHLVTVLRVITVSLDLLDTKPAFGVRALFRA